jgi:hypothetical protein
LSADRGRHVHVKLLPLLVDAKLEHAVVVIADRVRALGGRDEQVPQHKCGKPHDHTGDVVDQEVQRGWVIGSLRG